MLDVLSAGMKPFVELSFMPSQLAKKKTYGLHYRNNTSIPKSWKEWNDYIESFIRYLIVRYGSKEVESWKFEVWNEPDLKGGFFSGSQQDYFRLYEVTARAVKKVNARIQVGGPSTSACRWIDEFVSWCHEHDVPLDFISTHHYPGDAFGNLITPANYGGIFKTMVKAVREKDDLTETLGKMFFQPQKAAEVTKDALVKMDDELRAKVKDLPVYITEWNSMAIYAACVHDEKYSAAFALKSVLDLNHQFDGYFFWCLSDLFEEQIQLNRPFSGGYGILNIDGIPKPNFHAFKILSKLYPERLDTGFRAFGEIEYAAFIDEEGVQIVLCAQSSDPEKDDVHEYEITVNTAAYEVYEERIDDDHCNPKRLWKEMGSPANLSPEQKDFIMTHSAMVKEAAPFETDGQNTMIRGSLRTNDIVLYTLKTGGRR